MASKHAALYFEAYKQHHLVCSSLHTLSCEVSRVLGRALHDIVTRPFDVDGRVVGFGVLFDCVSAVGLDSDLAFFLDFSNFSTRLSRAPVP